MEKNRQKSVSGDFFEYIQWRGDLDFNSSPFNDVDALILCQLSYLKLNELVPSSFENFISLAETAENFKSASDYEERKNLGMMINQLSTDLFYASGKSVRFGKIKLCGFIDNYSQKNEEQFSAVTFVFDDIAFCAYRGTDDTLIGWKEDFNLAFMKNVPAQIDGLNYLKAAMSSQKLKAFNFMTGGHSKGGNLAVFSAAKIDLLKKDKLLKVYNFDGPGFSRNDLQSEDFISVKSKIVSVYPQMSMIGMLFNHYDGYKVARSTEKLIMQHDPFSWQVRATDFDLLPGLEDGSELFFKSFNTWFEALSSEKRETFVETVFGVLMASEATTNSELAANALKSAGRILRAFVSLDSDIRDEALGIVGDFLKVTGHEVKEFIGL